MSPRQKVWGLGGLFLVWIAVLTVRFLSATEPQHVPLKFASKLAGTTMATESVTRLSRSADSGQQLKTPPAKYKNIFQPLPLMLAAEKPVAANVTQRVRLHDVKSTEEFHRRTKDRIQREEDQSRSSSAQSFEQLSALSFIGPPAPPAEVLSAKEAYRRRELALQEARSRDEAAVQEAKRQEELLVRQARQQKETALQQARQLMGQYRFLGFVSQDGQQHAFLGKGHELFVVSSGETVDGRLRIKAMDANSVKLLDPGTSLETTLVLVKDGKETF
jgi:hypothetical protein